MKLSKIKITISLISFIFCFGLSFFVYAAVNNAQSSSLLTDSDQDGLSDVEERSYGTDPLKADTDNDSYSDGVEIKSGYNPLKPAPGDRLIETITASNKNGAENLTEKLTSSVIPFLEQKVQNQENLTVNELNDKVSEILKEDLNDPVTVGWLPDFTISPEKIIVQNYSSLSEAKQKEKRQNDTTAYLTNLSYIVSANLPTDIQTTKDIEPFFLSLGSHLSDLSQTPANYTFYSRLKPNLERITNETRLMQVPEGLAGMHQIGVRIMMGYLKLANNAPTTDDPVLQIKFLQQISDLNKLTADYLRQAVSEIQRQYGY